MRRLPGERGEDLLVADRLAGGRPRGEAAPREPRDLLNEPLRDHAVNALVDAGVEALPRHGEAPDARVVVGGAAAEALVVAGVGDAVVEHLERADDAPDVIGVDERGALGVALREQGVEPLRAPLGRKRLVALARGRPALAGRELHLVDDRVEVEARAPREHGGDAASQRVVDARAGVALEEPDGVVLKGVDDVDHEQGDSPVRRGRLRGAHVHAAVHLHRVDGDDGPAEALGDELGDGALA